MQEVYPAIIASSLKKSYSGDVVALDGLSFEVAPGTVFGRLGPTARASPQR
jgi:ABC-type multidrug transport system ATPase subunit